MRRYWNQRQRKHGMIKDLLYSWMGRIITVKKVIVTMLKYSLSAVLIKILMSFLMGKSTRINMEQQEIIRQAKAQFSRYHNS